MNYFAHGLPHIDRPYFLIGTALPDMLPVVDRTARLRTKTLLPYCEDAVDTAADLAAGACRHLHDDAWFHGTRAFAEVSAEIATIFRDGLGGSDGFRCGFLGHVAMELLIDGVLGERFPDRMERYYAAFSQIDSGLVERWVSTVIGRPVERLDWFLDVFQQEQFLRDYSDNHRLVVRLNQVLGRVTLSPLPAAAADWLEPARTIVRERLHDLLPASHYRWPN